MIKINNTVIETKTVKLHKSALKQLIQIKKNAIKLYGNDVEVRFEA